MEQFPKIARARMAAELEGTHPESEQLNAFTENALTESERGSIMAHLAACADCRKIVHLAVEARSAEAPVTRPARGGFRWATFQWAAVAASVAIVMVAVLVVGPKETRTPRRANESAALQRQAAPPPVAPATASDAIAKPELEASGKVAKQRTGVAIGSGAGLGTVAGGGVGGAVYRAEEKKPSSDELAKFAEKKEAPPVVAPPKSAPARDLAYGAPGAQDADTFNSSVRPAPALNQPAQGQIARGPLPVMGAIGGEGRRAQVQTKSSNEIRKDKAPATDTVAETSSESVQVNSQAATIATYAQKDSKKTQSGKLKQQGTNAAPIYAAKLDALPRLWRVNSGKVQSSDDGGSLWQDHRVATGFQATKVVASEQQVWLGGRSGTLYLSRDAGQTWAKVSLTGDDIIPLGDVADIKITDPQLVDVLLNSGDDWQSSDGGKSFRLVPRKP